ncbi:uncharacterized protein LOC127808030 isoform X2 [Diospyros lotus]|uniref:uncharacterized protein LOC127808030 isoform X2 n=1 Tax=Diospyros lotus TaxID=55363 RepID=UPI00225BD3B7|nr:uncharacterized protein LOC127808030 isoform X2 [Diospyros lotus]
MERSNPARKSKNVHHIGGIAVEFPYQPYGSQLAFMAKVISTLDRALRDGHSHALLESPTGTGKSLSLLCSVLAWQQSYPSRKIASSPAISKPAPEAMTDPLAYGGGFIPESQPSAPGNPDPAPPATNNKASKKKTTPTIFYASRTHSQIAQVIREYKKTTYRVPMAVLASRKHYCTNRHVNGKKNIDEECKLLLSNREVGCSEFKNANKVKGHSSLKKGGCHEVYDIEDLVKIGQEMKGCSYFAARSMADDAQLVFCPYSYIINPLIRKAMEVDIKGAILILDEAHNIEDMAREAGSMDAEEDALHKLQTELGELAVNDAMTYQPLYEMIQDLVSWIERRKNTLEKHEFQHYFSCWTGDKALRELHEANISQQCFPILQECATKAIKIASDAEPEVAHLTSMSAMALAGLFSSLNYFFSGNGVHVYDYQLVLRRYIKKDAGQMHSLSLWCLNPAVVFRDIANLSLSVILTSGTLSPMNSFSSELGVQFGTCLEAPHVIDVESQLWAAVISTGPGNYRLNASYKTADAYAFQDALGTALEKICKIVPGGSLIFFPSYKLMEKLCKRWHATGQWSRLNAQKSLFVEPMGGSQDDFEHVLRDYYNTICQSKRPAVGKKRRGKRLGLSNCYPDDCTENCKEGAAFLAVCRGKVSEGIDFSDENARVVIIVGIPFPNINDIQVVQKKRYNDTYKSSRHLLSGNEWYCQQAFRALNQAAGRCIRHRFDYGAVILLDERFREERNTTYISKWLRKSIRQYDNFENSLEELKSFFRTVKERLGKDAVNTTNNLDVNVESTAAVDRGKGFVNKNKKLNKSNEHGPKLVSESIISMEKSTRLSQCPTPVTTNCVTFILSESEDNVEVQELLIVDEKDVTSSRECVDLDCSFQKDLGYPRALSMEFSSDDPEISIVRETPSMNVSPLASPRSFSKDENSNSTIIEAPGKIQDQLLLHSRSPTYSNAAHSKSTSSLVVTPEKYVSANMNSHLGETESVLNLSVNSHTQKRRKPSGLKSVNLMQVEQFDVPDPRVTGHSSSMASSMITKAENCRDKFVFETSCSPNELTMPSVTQLLTGNNAWVSCTASGHVMNKRLQIFCSCCRNPLGLPQNHLYIRCSITSLSKVHLTTLLKGRSEAAAENISTSIPVVISDISSVDQRLCDITPDSVPGQGIWCREDGCVFNAIFCPFCSKPNNCLGVQVMATDTSNVQLLDKILFYLDRLEIKNPDASEDKDLSPACSSGFTSGAFPISIEKFSYIPPQQHSGGWRTTKSKMQLPKRQLLPTSGGRGGT